MATHPGTQVLIPVKAFDRAKARLAPALTVPERAELARTMATSVVHAVGDLPVWVVCDDPSVAAWARSAGCAVSWQPGRGLDGAVQQATSERFTAGAGRVVVIHSDLPLVTSVRSLDPGTDELLLAPDRHGAGTNVVSTPTPQFRFSYGPGSFARHLAEAERLGLAVRTVHDPTLGWDVDVPDDLTVFTSGSPDRAR